ncbi:unnamed protein product, partial [marine sediment metagenome]
IGRDISTEMSYQENGCEKADDHHQAVAFYGQMDEGYLKKFRIHW